MQFSFLGVSYKHQPQTINTVESEITGKFIGKFYQVRRITRTSQEPNLKYRDITY